MERLDQLKIIQNESLELFKKKNKDYGDAFATYGAIGVIVRMGDKISRLLHVEKNKINMVNDEHSRDTLIDLHNYAAMAVMLIDESKEKISYTQYHHTSNVENENESDYSIMFNG